MFMRNRAERRKNTWAKIHRRAELEMNTEGGYRKPVFKYIHQYSKDKLHNPNRVFKTNNKGKHRYRPKNYAPSKNWSSSDQKKLDSINEQLNGVDNYEE
jgi:hypothetical protein